MIFNPQSYKYCKRYDMFLVSDSKDSVPWLYRSLKQNPEHFENKKDFMSSLWTFWTVELCGRVDF